MDSINKYDSYFLCYFFFLPAIVLAYISQTNICAVKFAFPFSYIIDLHYLCPQILRKMRKNISLKTNEFQIFCGERIFTLSADKEKCFKSINGIGTKLTEQQQLPELFDLFEESKIPEFYVYTKKPQLSFNYLIKSNQCLDAAGGIVFDRENNILLMRRLGYRDFPKGKIEPGETEIFAASREIEEECGIKDVEITEKLADTYHTYRTPDMRIIKRTAWFKAKYSGSQPAQPQIEEDITEIIWISRNEIENFLPEMYASLRGLIKLI